MTDDNDLLDQVRAETARNPDWFGVLVTIGADHVGLDMGHVRHAWARAREGRALAHDVSQDPRRRDVCGRIGSHYAQLVLDLAIQGQRVVNMCRARAVAERAPVNGRA